MSTRDKNEGIVKKKKILYKIPGGGYNTIVTYNRKDAGKMNNNSKQNSRANLYVTLLVILMMIAVVVAIAGAVVRNVNTDAAETTKPASRVEETTKSDAADDALAEGSDKSGELAEKDGETKEDSSADTTVRVDGEAEEILPPFVNPTGGKVVQNYSMDVPVFSATMNDYRTHKGVDISVGAGESIHAAADGVIQEIWDDPMMGKCLSIAHAGGGVSTYANLHAELPAGIAAGTSVKAGDIIAAAGESALVEVAQEPHLHFELQINGTSVNPADYIDFSSAAEQYEG